ncbi:2-dehydro-3-deoxygalactonokinase [Exilibacterium tricleocarpae]|uniref:2-dehydro-3-deoxygalactonokinase n=1 Tax=Exilibacterium tricleocarpae TaxID=2591008 RepID=A0A545SY58_9GAMM|nr:2-dehydro-3-deoxygalactonokinase [Exilibacterium tricleocarpae]TQV69898.1 2-dehydro-3-deoxygalactonokinase [Exilibacterium tricleocarpae]
MKSTAPALIAVDWGSSAFRAYLLDHHQRVLDSVTSNAGVSQHARRHAEVLQQHCGPWLAATPHIPVYMSGVIGSRSGWQEVPYIPCPARLADVKRLLTRATGQQGTQAGESDIRIVPGISGYSPSGAPDVMRGEEVQTFGALDHLGTGSGLVCLPGTHSKWVQVDSDRLTSFATFMTGELYGLLRKEGAINVIIQNDTDDPEAFLAGVSAGESAGGLLHQIFSIRARHLTGQLPGAAVSPYLSGLLIGNELTAALTLYPDPDAVIVVGSDILTRHYTTALDHLGITTQVVAADQAFLRGIALVTAADCGQGQ